MSEAECRVAARVARVVGRGGVAFFQRLRHGSEGNGASPSAVADGLEFAVPVGGFGEPELHFNVRIGGWRENHGGAAMRLEDERRRGRCAAASAWCGASPGR